MEKYFKGFLITMIVGGICGTYFIQRLHIKELKNQVKELEGYLNTSIDQADQLITLITNEKES